MFVSSINYDDADDDMKIFKCKKSQIFTRAKYKIQSFVDRERICDSILQPSDVQVKIHSRRERNKLPFPHVNPFPCSLRLGLFSRSNWLSQWERVRLSFAFHLIGIFSITKSLIRGQCGSYFDCHMEMFAAEH